MESVDDLCLGTKNTHLPGNMPLRRWSPKVLASSVKLSWKLDLVVQVSRLEAISIGRLLAIFVRSFLPGKNKL